MGALALTNPGLQYDQQPGIDPSTGMPIQTAPIVKYFKNPGARALQFAKDATQAVQPSTSTVTGDLDNSQVVDNPAPVPTLPKYFQPSFRDVAGPNASGLPQQISPAETKLGKLFHILGAAAQGAAAGWGTGNAAAGSDRAIQMEQLPYQRIMAAQNLQKEIAQTNLVKQQGQMIPTPYGPMPVGMAKVMFPALIKSQSAQNVQQMKGQTAQAVANTNKRFMAVPGVGLYNTETKELVPQTAQGINITPEIAQEYGLPQQFIGKPMQLGQLSRLESNAAQFAPEVKTENTDLLGNTTSRSQKLRPTAGASGGVAAPALPASSAAGAPNMVQSTPGGALRPAGTAPGRSNAPKVLPTVNGQASASPIASSSPSQIVLPPDVEQRLQSALPNNSTAQNYVRGLLSYRGQMPSPRAKNYAQTLGLLTTIDPNFQASNYDAIRKTVMDYTPGGEVGRQVLAFNTAMRHVGMLSDAVDALNNGKLQVANKIGNAISVQLGQDPVTNFNTVKTYLSGELAKGFGGGMATDSSRAEANTILSTMQSPEQLKGGLTKAVDLLRGKIGAQEDAYKATVGRPISLLDQPAHQVLQKLGMEMPAGAQPTHIVNDANGNRIGTVVNGQYVADGK